MSAFDEVAADLRRRVAAGEWRPGQQLPDERTFAQAYGVSRNTLRRALDQLEADGLLLRHVGRGTFVRHSPAEDGLRGDALVGRMAAASPVTLHEARMIVEPQCAALAAARASTRDLDLIEDALRQSVGIADFATFKYWDRRLHQVIFEAAGNPLLADYCNALSIVRTSPEWMRLKMEADSPRQRALYDQQHRDIVAAIRSRNAVEAERTMREHLRSVRDSLQPML